MKLSLNQINPNPFKKEISKGHLDKEQVNRIKANIKELGLMGSLPIVKKDNKFFLVNGHHRVQALKETYGNSFQIEVTLHNYNDEQMLRGMVIENLTQRTDDFREINENLITIRKYLKKNVAVQTLNSKRKDGQDKRQQNIQEAGSVRQIAEWLNKNGVVLSVGRISEHLKIFDNLDKNLYDKVEKTHKGDADKRTDGETISFSQAEMLSRFDDKKEQKEISEVLLNSREQRVREQGKLLTLYKEAPEKVKKAVINREIDLADIPIVVHKTKIGDVNLNREQLSLEKSWEFQENLKKLLEEKMFLKKLPPSELEVLYHYLLNWIKGDLIPFMKAIEDEFKSRGNKKVVYYDLTERRN